jgi:hypothetical protein
VSSATPAASPAGGLLDRVERAAWQVPLPTRRLYLTLAVVAAAALAVSGLIAGWVVNRNADTIDDAREQGLELATAVTEYRTHLASADATAAATLIAGGLESTESRARYDEDLLQASAALTRAGLVARPEDGDSIEDLSEGLVEYAGLVESSRAYSRLGYPVGAAYLNVARDMVNDELVPTADQLRREGERRMADAANTVGGPLSLSLVAVVLLVAALIVLVGCAALVAGRSRRVIAHPALVGAFVAAVAALALVLNGILSQGSELRQAASGDIDTYLAANEAASALATLRVTEISAIAARGTGAELYAEFTTDAADGDAGADEEQPQAQALLDALDESGDDPGVADLRRAVANYVITVHQLEELDLAGGDNQAAARLALSTDPDAGELAPSGFAYAVAATGSLDPDAEPTLGSAQGNVAEATDVVEARFDAAADAGASPAVPVALGLIAAALAAGGTLARGRRYR